MTETANERVPQWVGGARLFAQRTQRCLFRIAVILVKFHGPTVCILIAKCTGKFHVQLTALNYTEMLSKQVTDYCTRKFHKQFTGLYFTIRNFLLTLLKYMTAHCTKVVLFMVS